MNATRMKIVLVVIMIDVIGYLKNIGRMRRNMDKDFCIENKRCSDCGHGLSFAESVLSDESLSIYGFLCEENAIFDGSFVNHTGHATPLTIQEVFIIALIRYQEKCKEK
jgi:hypothetical protein